MYKITIEKGVNLTKYPSLTCTSTEEVQRLISSLKRTFSKYGKVKTIIINHEIRIGRLDTKLCIFRIYNSNLFEDYNVKVERI